AGRDFFERRVWVTPPFHPRNCGGGRGSPFHPALPPGRPPHPCPPSRVGELRDNCGWGRSRRGVFAGWVPVRVRLHVPVCQWRSKMSHLWRLKMSHSAGGDEPLVRRRLPAASLPPRSIVAHLTAGGLEGLVELVVVPHAVAVAADAHDVAVVEQAVDQRGRN